MTTAQADQDRIAAWTKSRVRKNEISRYMEGDEDFIPDAEIAERLRAARAPDWKRLEEILARSSAVATLAPEETAALSRVTDPEMWARMAEVAGRIKRQVYDNRIVTFAPLYLSNHCVNNCAYCGLRSTNQVIRRRALPLSEVRRETAALAGGIGHKRLIVVYGEHPDYDVDYMVDTIKAIYGVKVPTRRGTGEIRRVNVNAAPLSIADLRKLNEAGLGTYQVFQETYHRETYRRLHPAGTLKADFRWRLYAMHRAMEAGIDDVGIGALFGLADWRYELMALVYHAHELEKRFGIGPHTISFPRLEPAANTPFNERTRRVSDEDFKKIVILIRLSVPYTGMILTARESAEVRRQVLPLGVTQLDASSQIGVGAYAEGAAPAQEGDRQQFMLGDTRSLDEVVRELAQMGHITSFCTAGYRCGRTGKCIMELLRTGAEGKFCKMNAVLTFREWLNDFASPETKEAGERVLARELGEVEKNMPRMHPRLMESYNRIQAGERDLFF
jgi:2-iminoacetate synthase